MILFFKTPQQSVIATQVDHTLSTEEVQELCWLYGEAQLLEGESLKGSFVGPRREMITPWSTNAVEITQNMNLHGISRIEEYFPTTAESDAVAQPSNIAIITVALCIEQFGYGFGFTAYMLYMMYFSEGEFKTSPSA